MEILKALLINMKYMKALSKIATTFLFSILIISIAYSQDSLSLSRSFKPDLRIDTTKIANLNFNNFNVNKLPFFCKLEELWSQSSGMNVRFRIGNLEYVDKLEGKK